MRYKIWIPVILFGISTCWVDFKLDKWKMYEVFHYDTFGYYNYLPAIFIYQDVKQYRYLDTIIQHYHPFGQNLEKFGLHPVEKTGNLCNRYSMGVAMFQLPGFFIADVWTRWTRQDTPNGFSFPYQHSAVLSTWIFSILGMLLLTAFLKNYFSSVPIIITMLCIGFATNLFQYASLDSGYSHAYLFFCYSAILFLTDRWYQRPNYRDASLLGLCIGLCILTRPIDGWIAIVPLLWIIPNQQKRITFFKQHYKHLVLACLFAFIAILPQIIYWKYVTGDWIYYSYPKESDYFHWFDRPRIVQGLFGYRKGWFVYTPVALIAFIAMFLIKRNHPLHFYKKLFWFFYIPMIYLVFAWHCWFYGWSYGCRALLQTLPLLAIPLAFLTSEILNLLKYQRILWYISVAFFIFLNLFQTWQFNRGILHGSMMTEELYWNNFLRTSRHEKNEKLLDYQHTMECYNGW